MTPSLCVQAGVQKSMPMADKALEALDCSSSDAMTAEVLF